MELELILNALAAGGVHPILVAVTHDSDADMEFQGSLEEFFDALKALETKAVFVSSYRLNDTAFAYLPDDEDELESEAEEPFDLCSFEPALEGYRSRIGDLFRVEVCVPLRIGSLKYVEESDWFKPLPQLLADAKDAIDSDREAAMERREAEEEARAEKLFEDLRNLIKDKEFVKLRTQAAMREYALERFPQLQLVSSADLKREIAQLVARIDAKGLNRK